MAILNPPPTQPRVRPVSGVQTGSSPINLAPGFESLAPGTNQALSASMSNILNLLKGTPSLDRARNAGASFAAYTGQAPTGTGNTGDFMDRYLYDLYGGQAEASRAAGGDALLKFLQGVSGTVMPTTGEELARTQGDLNRALEMRGQDIQQRGQDIGQREFDTSMDYQKWLKELPFTTIGSYQSGGTPSAYGFPGQGGNMYDVLASGAIVPRQPWQPRKI